MYYIYKITNLINNKVYIGQTHQGVNNNAAASSILQVCKGNRQTAYGYKWQYVEEDDDKPARECTVDQVK